jgi:hypothetical protein
LSITHGSVLNAMGRPPPRLAADYPNVKAKVVAEQLERAGVRLAAVLNAALK